MATNTLTDRSAGETIQEGFFNDIHQALEGVVVGRNSSGVPTSGQSLGTPALPWGTIYGNGIVIGGSSVDTSQVAAPPFRVTSGKTRTSSNQPAYLTPAGSGNGASVTVAGATTNLAFDVNGVSYTITSDIVKASLTLAPSSNNTALVNDTEALGADETRLWGEELGEKKVITFDTAGSEITSRDGEYHAFLKGSEVWFAKVDGSDMVDVRRGYFYDENLAPTNRTPLSDNNTITLLSTNYLFADIDGSTIDFTVTQPVVSHTAPSSPATGDYWFDLGNTLWKRYDGAQFQTVDRTFIGYAVCDDTDCLYARCVDFDARYKLDNSIDVQVGTTEIVESQRIGDLVNVAGNEIVFTHSRATWNITTDLAGSEDMYIASEQSSTTYSLYVADDGETIISDIDPYVRRDLGGARYHPHNPWRYVGSFRNDGSSDIVNSRNEPGPNNQIWQVKAASGDITANGNISSMTFNNLIPGRTYMIMLHAYATPDNDDTINISAKDGSTTIFLHAAHATASGSATHISTSMAIYEMSGTTLTFDAGSISGTSSFLGDGTRGETHATLVELKDHENIDQF